MLEDLAYSFQEQVVILLWLSWRWSVVMPAMLLSCVGLATESSVPFPAELDLWSLLSRPCCGTSSQIRILHSTCIYIFIMKNQLRFPVLLLGKAVANFSLQSIEIESSQKNLSLYTVNSLALWWKLIAGGFGALGFRTWILRKLWCEGKEEGGMGSCFRRELREVFICRMLGMCCDEQQQ